MSSQGHGLQACNVIHFFKIILQRSLRDGEIRIPKSFVTKCGKELSNPVLLRLPNGAEWEVNWVKRDGDVWFQNGWKKFAEYYSLAHGHLLVFRYERRSQFQVLIFDMSASEIDYSGIRGTNEDEEVKLDQESDESDDSVEILYESERPRSPFHNPLPRKRMKTMSNGEPKSYSNPYVETKGTRFQRAKHHENRKINVGLDTTQPKARGCSRGCLFKTRKCSKSEDIKGKVPLEDIESSRTLERARAFQSENPFIIRRMQPSHVHGNFMAIPSHFSRTYLQGKQGTATIRVSGERTWPVKYKFNMSTNRTILSTGWSSFVKDNHLKEGDVCIFEMIGCTQVSFKIVIFPASEEPSSCTLKDCDQSPKVSNEFESDNCFNILLKHSDPKLLNSNIPNDFLKRYIRCHDKDAALQVGDKLWHVKVLYYSDNSFGRFSAGWLEFVRGCKLKAGDICHFELIDKENLVLNVSISRHQR